MWSQEHLHPDDAEYAAGVMKKVLANPGKSFTIMFRAKNKKGNYIWLEGIITNMIHEPTVKAIITNFRDITQKKEGEEKLIASEKQFRHTLDNMLEGMQIIGFDWRYIYVNDAMARHGKYSKEELIGHTVMEKYPGIEQTEVYKVYKRCFEERISIHMENEFVFPDKTKAWFELSFQPVPEGIFILSVDISERKMAEEKINNLNRELEERVIMRTEQLKKSNEELEAFSYSVSHDLRAPLRGIIGFANILEEDYTSKLDDEAKRITAIIKKNTSKMGQLIDDLLAFSRMGRQELIKTTVDINKMVGDIIGDYSLNNEKTKWIVHSLPDAIADINTLQQVWA
ncbi:MAG: PAS domain-containing sensor histidine kinase, partial [Ginsengibacter sp.]